MQPVKMLCCLTINHDKLNTMNAYIPEKTKIFSGSALKFIAAVIMMIDHTTKALIYNCVIKGGNAVKLVPFMSNRQLYNILRGVGRLAFPIFCFFIVEGFLYTRNRTRYFMRLLLFGVISEIPFDLGLYESRWYPRHQNVMFELALAVLMLWTWEAIGRSRRLHGGLLLILQALSAAGFLIAAQKLHLDYGFKGLSLILVLYLLRFERITQCTAGALNIAIWEWPAVFAFPLMCLYNGKRGRSIKYFFYAFYPGHLALLALLTGILKNRI